MAINFGILDTQPQRPSVQVVQTGGAGDQNATGLSQGLLQGSEMNNQRAQLAIQQKELQMKQQAQPGILKGQDLLNQGQSLTNQKSQMEIGGAQYQIKQRQDRQQAYEDGKAKGGTEAGLDAMQEKLYSSGDPADVKAGLEMATNRETLKANIAADNKKAVVATASNVMGVMQHAQKDPKTGQYLPGKSPLDLYSASYSQIKKLNPDAPAPNSFKNNNDFEDTYVQPVLDTSHDYIARDKAKYDEQVKNQLYQAQSIVKDNVTQLQNDIRQYGPNSQQAKDSAKALQQAQFHAQTISNNNNYLSNTLRGIGDAFTPDNTIQDYSPKAPAPAAPAPAAPANTVPAGRVQVRAKDGTIGHIPAAQLQEAIKAGYTQVQAPQAPQGQD